MYVSHLEVTDFRSWEQAELTFDPGIAVLVGANGQGKTNLLEALGYLATLGSHRVSADAALVRQGAESAIVRATVVHEGRELTVELQISPGKANRARVNRSPVPRAREVLGILRTVLFAPEDLALVRGDPSERRRFIDDLLVTRSPRLAGVRAEYDKILRQRSALLKSAGAARYRGRRSSSGEGDGSSAGALQTLDVWDGHLAATGSQLLAARLDLLTSLGPHVSAAYATVAPDSRPVDLRYRTSLAESYPEVLSDGPADVDLIEAALLAQLAKVRSSELERGVCLVGPQRDDIDLLLGDTVARGYASHGESWSFALALRLGSFELLRGEGSEPVLLLDDVFAELDSRRRQRLCEVATSAEQVLVTAAVAEDVPEALDGARIDVHGGTVKRIR